jgi:hypothetical protein
MNLPHSSIQRFVKWGFRGGFCPPLTQTRKNTKQQKLESLKTTNILNYTYPQPTMPLICDALLPETVARLYDRICRLPANNPLRKDCLDGDVRVYKQNDVMILHGPSSFYFEHMATPELESELARHIRTPRAYHCTTFEVDRDDPSVIEKLLDRFQEQHGVKMRNMIDWCLFKFGSKELMLCKLPPCVLRHMLAPTGGLMKSAYSGPADKLGEISTLAKLGVLSNEFVVDGRIKSMLVTEYKQQHYEAVMRLHWDLVREVIARPHSGITLGPVAQWDA